MKTLAQQVDQLACRCLAMEGIAGEMLATIQLNVERGYLVAQNDEGKLNLQTIIASWQRQLAQLDEVDPRIQAPWTEAQVQRLNAFQQRGEFHPFTCSNGSHVLTATVAGWVCEECARQGQSYQQDWCHEFMTK